MITFICISLTLQNDLVYMDLIKGKRRIDKRKATKHETCLWITIYHNLQQTSWAWVGKAGLGLCGLDQTGRTLSTYQGSCDRIHSVFLVLFWLGMDLEKQKDGATDMHVWNCLEWTEDLLGMFLLDRLCEDRESLGRNLFFTTLHLVLTASSVQEGG